MHDDAVFSTSLGFPADIEALQISSSTKTWSWSTTSLTHLRKSSLLRALASVSLPEL